MENNKLDKRTKWSYCIGATGRDMAYALVSMFLLTYIQYTMKLTVAQYAVISAIMVVCLLWDAINDPMMGIIIENSHLKAGKFKPWIFIGVILNSLIIICLFTVRPEGWGFVAFFGVGYLLWGMTYTMNDIAYWGMLPSLTSDPGERNWLVTVQGIFICIGQFSVAGLLPDMVAGNAIMAYRTAAIVIAFCFIGFQLLTVFGVKERKRPEKKRTLSLKDIGPIGLYTLTKKADADADLPDTMKRPYIAQVITFDVLYDIEEAKTELQYLFSVIDMFDLSDNNKKMFLQEILQYWILSVKDSKWKAERERRYVIFLYDDYEYIETELDDTFLKVKTSLFITPDFIIGKNPSKWEIMRQLAAKRKALFSKEYLFCENCLMQDHDVAIHEKPEKCPICGSKNIRMIYHENA